MTQRVSGENWIWTQILVMESHVHSTTPCWFSCESCGSLFKILWRELFLEPQDSCHHIGPYLQVWVGEGCSLSLPQTGLCPLSPLGHSWGCDEHQWEWDRTRWGHPLRRECLVWASDHQLQHALLNHRQGWKHQHSALHGKGGESHAKITSFLGSAFHSQARSPP